VNVHRVAERNNFHDDFCCSALELASEAMNAGVGGLALLHRHSAVGNEEQAARRYRRRPDMHATPALTESDMRKPVWPSTISERTAACISSARSNASAFGQLSRTTTNSSPA
jgi:hypothetical protein